MVCSEACRRVVYKRHRAERRERRSPMVCAACGTSFVPRGRTLGTSRPPAGSAPIASGSAAERRANRKAMPHEAAVAELRACSGTHFDPKVVDALAMVSAGGNHRQLSLAA